jgi:hypothetical protein
MKFPPILALTLVVAACSSPPLPELEPTGPSSPEAPTVAAPYRSVMAGTAPHEPVGLKSWRQLNDEVAPNAGRSP